MKKVLYIIERYSLIVVLLGVIPLILPYFHKGYFPTHDGEWAVVRAAEMFREVRDHQFPPRYSDVLNLGYGYPLFNFTYPLPYYLTTILHVFKFGFVDSVKMLFASSIIISALGMYFLSSKIWNSKSAGALSALLYVYFPYRIVDLFVRGSLGESVAFMIVPWMAFFLIQYIEKRTNIFLALSALSIGLLTLSHNIMALYFLPFITFFVYFYGKQTGKKAILPLFLSLLLGLSLSTFFIAPAIMEKNNIALSKIPIADRNLYFASLTQLLMPKWGYGTPTDADGFSYQIGFGYIIIFILGVGYIIKSFSDKKMIEKNSLLIYLVGITMIMILFMFSFTSVVWKLLPLLSEINYPWTLLGPIGFVLSILSGFIFIHMKGGKYILIFLTLVALLLVIPYAHPKEYIDKGDGFYLTNEATTTSSDELMPLWVRDKPTSRYKNKVEVVQGNVKITNLQFNSRSLSFDTPFFAHTKDDPIKIRINTIYYPGWNAYVDGKKFPISLDQDKGTLELYPESADQHFSLIFSETPLRITADGISLFSFFSIILLIWFFKKRVFY